MAIDTVIFGLLERGQKTMNPVACGNISAPGLGQVGRRRKFAPPGGANDHLQILRGLGFQKNKIFEENSHAKGPKVVKRSQRGAKGVPKGNQSDQN